MHIDFLLDKFITNHEREAIVWRDRTYQYDWMAAQIERYRHELACAGISPGRVVSLEADFSPSAVALFVALVDAGCIIVPLTKSVADRHDEYMRIAQVETSISVDHADKVNLCRADISASHPLFDSLRRTKHPGLVLFSSGSTGVSKATVHDVVPLVEKFRQTRHRLRTLSFLLYDHIGGINTMLYTLANGGCMVTVRDRTPDTVLSAIERYNVELLPTSPTFINLILISEAYRRFDLSCLKTISYGTEPMPESTLRRLREALPRTRLLQTYGLSEVGILRSKSENSDSLWVKIGGEGYQTRVVDGTLQIKARSAMLGYLNADSPFTSDGWLDTGDRVEVRGEYMRILGRKSEIINVGGQKVYPAEVENVIHEFPGVAEVVVSAEQNAITGQIVFAKVRLVAPTESASFAADLKRYCRQKLQPHKVPVKIEISQQLEHSCRFKKHRRVA